MSWAGQGPTQLSLEIYVTDLYQTIAGYLLAGLWLWVIDLCLY